MFFIFHIKYRLLELLCIMLSLSTLPLPLKKIVEASMLYCLKRSGVPILLAAMSKTSKIPLKKNPQMRVILELYNLFLNDSSHTSYIQWKEKTPKSHWFKYTQRQPRLEPQLQIQLRRDSLCVVFVLRYFFFLSVAN